METAATIEAPRIEQTLNLRLPRGLNFFTQDRGEIEKIREHFAPIIEQVRERCGRAGLVVTDATRYTGEIHVTGDPDVMHELAKELAQNNLIYPPV